MPLWWRVSNWPKPLCSRKTKSRKISSGEIPVFTPLHRVRKSLERVTQLFHCSRKPIKTFHILNDSPGWRLKRLCSKTPVLRLQTAYLKRFPIHWIRSLRGTFVPHALLCRRRKGSRTRWSRPIGPFTIRKLGLPLGEGKLTRVPSVWESCYRFDPQFLSKKTITNSLGSNLDPNVPRNSNRNCSWSVKNMEMSSYSTFQS